MSDLNTTYKIVHKLSKIEECIVTSQEILNNPLYEKYDDSYLISHAFKTNEKIENLLILLKNTKKERNLSDAVLFSLEKKLTLLYDEPALFFIMGVYDEVIQNGEKYEFEITKALQKLQN